MMDALVPLILGLLLRIGIPVFVSVLIFFLLRRLDERWQKEARALPVISSRQPCWEVKGCSPEKRQNCSAFAQTNIPCWQTFRARDGALRDECLGCAVFRMAPVPATI
jgi:hypothetical protein